MRLDDLQTFLQVCADGSFTAVARDLGVPTSTVTRRVARLEEELGTPLLVRGAEGVRPTEVGLEVRSRGERVLQEVASLRMEAGRKPQTLRVVAPPELAHTHHLLSILARYGEDHPDVQVELLSTARRVDLATDGVDVVIRLHLSPLRGGPSLMTRRLGMLRGGIYAAPSLIEGRSLDTPADLARWPVVTTGGGVLRNHWPLEHPHHGSVDVPIRPVLRLSDLLVVRSAAIAGHGAALLPPFLAREAEQTGALRQLLVGWRTAPARVSLLWADADPLPPHLRDFLDRIGALDPGEWDLEAR